MYRNMIGNVERLIRVAVRKMSQKREVPHRGKKSGEHFNHFLNLLIFPLLKF